MAFAYDIEQSAEQDARDLAAKSNTIIDYCDSIIYVCDQIDENWKGEDGTFFVQKLRARCKAIQKFASDGILPLGQGIVEYLEAMKEITSKSSK